MQNLASAMLNRRIVLTLTAAIVCSMPAWAQRQPIRRVLMSNVKADRVADFEAAVKQYNEVYAKVPGVRSTTVLQSLTGPYQFVLVRNYDKWADLDPGPVSKAIAANAELARINLRINSCIESSTMLVEELLPDLSMPRPDGPPELIRLARNRVRPDKTAEFEAIIKDELLPAHRKAGSKAFTVRRVRFGGPGNDYYMSTRLDGWADVATDSIRKAMGDEAYKRMVAKLTAITISRELNVYRFRADLSYDKGSPATAPTTAAVR
jgi:antibiotic biosynthesis monooxygenase (ABM) superfamily enzyme